MVDPAETLRLELEDIFLAHDTMSEPIEIDGLAVRAIVDRVDCGEFEGVGVGIEQMILLLMAATLDKPKIGQELNVNGQIWNVSATQTMNGVLELQLYRDVS